MKIFSFFIALTVSFFFFISCGSDEGENSEASSDGEACESTMDCQIGYTCDTKTKTCSKNGGGQDNSGNGDQETNGDSGNSSDDNGNSGKQDGDDDPITGPCTPGKKQTCEYEGPAGTEGVGECKAAVRTCDESGKWGKCENGHEPVTEIGELCGNGLDDDCNGTVDDGTDLDGDGFGACSDCCEKSGDCNGLNPAGVNPGGIEMPGDGVDNNCNGEIDESTSCDSEDAPLPSTSISTVEEYNESAVKLAHAMGICGDQLVSATLSLAGDPVTETINGSPRQSLPLPYYDATYKTFAVEDHFGNNIVPKEGSKIAILSTGPWNKPTRNEYSATLAAGDMRTASKIPSDWINMMPNCMIPKSPSCPGGVTVEDGLTNQCDGKTIPSVQDPIMLTLEVKVPMNARAFEFNLFFFSVEYPSTVCRDENFNDFFIALLDSEHNTKYPNDEYQNPYDKNLAKDYNGNFVGVDLAPLGLFQVCGSNGNYADNCTQGTTLLEGTGFDTFNSGGTGWLVTRGNVVPGETIKLRFALWEQGTVGYGPDHSWDSTVLLDGFKWLPTPAKAGTSQQ